MTKILGIEFAPLNIPLERRLQTLACMIHIFIFTLYPFFITLFSIYLLFTKYWFINVGYFTWWIYHNYIAKVTTTISSTSYWLRGAAHMHYFRDYFPVTLVKTVDLDPNKNYILGSHPHGIVPAGAFINFGSDATGFTDKFPGIKVYLMTLKANLKLPIVREYLLWMGKHILNVCLYVCT